MVVSTWDPNREKGSGKESATVIDNDQLASFLRLPVAGPFSVLALEAAGVVSLQHVMRLDVDVWEVAEGLTTSEIVHLIRVFTLIESIPGWEAGDKSPVISLVKILKSRGEFGAELRKWIKSNSDNRYLPYGSVL